MPLYLLPTAVSTPERKKLMPRTDAYYVFYYRVYDYISCVVLFFILRSVSPTLGHNGWPVTTDGISWAGTDIRKVLSRSCNGFNVNITTLTNTPHVHKHSDVQATPVLHNSQPFNSPVFGLPRATVCPRPALPGVGSSPPLPARALRLDTYTSVRRRGGGGGGISPLFRHTPH